MHLKNGNRIRMILAFCSLTLLLLVDAAIWISFQQQLAYFEEIPAIVWNVCFHLFFGILLSFFQRKQNLSATGKRSRIFKNITLIAVGLITIILCCFRYGYGLLIYRFGSSAIASVAIIQYVVVIYLLIPIGLLLADTFRYATQTKNIEKLPNNGGSPVPAATEENPTEPIISKGIRPYIAVLISLGTIIIMYGFEMLALLGFNSGDAGAAQVQAIFVTRAYFPVLYLVIGHILLGSLLSANQWKFIFESKEKVGFSRAFCLITIVIALLLIALLASDRFRIFSPDFRIGWCRWYMYILLGYFLPFLFHREANK